MRERVKEIEAMLSRADFKEIAAEYKRTKRAIGRRPDWHALYEGPKTVQELAERLKRAASYEILHKEWSERVHAADAIDRILTHNSSGPAARSLRDPTELNSAIDFAITFALDAARCLIRHYRPGEEAAFSKWVKTEVMPIWKKLPKIEMRSSSRD
jgi:hypothetical protein